MPTVQTPVKLVDQYSINHTNLALRRRFARFEERDVKVLAGLVGWARRRWVPRPCRKERCPSGFGNFPDPKNPVPT
ncbi:MAG: hypothetical protein U0821_17545 [Chloroflexota bacterium]